MRATLTEGKRSGAVDFFIGGDLNIELKLDITDDEHRGLDSIEWYGMYGSEWRRGYYCFWKIEVVPIVERFQLHRDQHLDEQ